MSVIFHTAKPETLLSEFDKRIEQKEANGKITTWQKSDDGEYYTHKATDWAKKAWFKPSTSDGRLTFNIVEPKNRNVTTLVYAYYHGHLIETFLNHFDQDFSSAQATALAASGDKCS